MAGRSPSSQDRCWQWEPPTVTCAFTTHAVWTTGKINENSPEHLHEKVNPDEIQFAMKSLISLRIPLPVPSSSW